MNKVDGTGKTGPIMRSRQTDKVGRNEQKIDILSSVVPKGRSLKQLIAQYLKDVDRSDGDAVIAAYVKGSLVFQLGQEILNDVDYSSLFDGVVEKIQNSKAMRESILNTLLEIDRG